MIVSSPSIPGDFVFVGSSSLLASAGHSSDGCNLCLWDTLLPQRSAKIQSFAAHDGGSPCLVYSPKHQVIISGQFWLQFLVAISHSIRGLLVRSSVTRFSKTANKSKLNYWPSVWLVIPVPTAMVGNWGYKFAILSWKATWKYNFFLFQAVKREKFAYLTFVRISCVTRSKPTTQLSSAWL